MAGKLPQVEPEDARLARIDTELYEARKLLERGDLDGARIAAWSALQLADRERLVDLAREAIELIERCDRELPGGSRGVAGASSTFLAAASR